MNTPVVQIPKAELDFSFARSSAPGGQNVNKVNSKAVLRWNLQESQAISQAVKDRFRARFPSRITVEGDVVIHSDEHREQGRNVDACVEKLQAMVAQVLVPPKPRRATRPSKGSVKRRLNDKSVQGKKKEDRRFRDD